MDKIGIPRSIFYYYYKDFWTAFFKYLKIPYIVSSKTNKQIIEKGINISNDEMCLALKIYLGHIDYLKDKCDYILIPRIDNFKIDNQTCTNFLSIYDITKNLFNIKIINYNIDLENNETLKKGMLKIGKKLNVKKTNILKAYKYAIKKYQIEKEKEINKNIKKLKSKKTKILIVSHPYIINDNLIGKEIINYLEKNKIAVIYSDKFDEKITNKLSKEISKNNYFKYSKENIGALIYAKDKIDGVIFLSAFPCALDSLVNELAMRKITKPYINIVLDDNSSFTGIETRIESFIDMLEGDLVE